MPEPPYWPLCAAPARGSIGHRRTDRLGVHSPLPAPSFSVMPSVDVPVASDVSVLPVRCGRRPSACLGDPVEVAGRHGVRPVRADVAAGADGVPGFHGRVLLSGVYNFSDGNTLQTGLVCVPGRRRSCALALQQASLAARTGWIGAGLLITAAGASSPLRRGPQGGAPSRLLRCWWPGAPGSRCRRSWSTGPGG